MVEIKMLKKIFVAAWAAVTLFMFYAIYTAGMECEGVGVLSFAIAFSIAALYRLSRMKGVDMKKDERTNKLTAYAATYSWFFAFMTVIVFYWVNYAGLYQISVSFVTGFLMMEMALSVALFKWILLRHGDVE